MEIEVLRSFQLSGTPPRKCGEVFTVPAKLGRELISQGLVKELRKSRKRKKPSEDKVVRPTEDK